MAVTRGQAKSLVNNQCPPRPIMTHVLARVPPTATEGAVAPREASPGLGVNSTNSSAGKPPMNRARRIVIGRKAQ